jgi:hypothetical protein
MIERPVIVLGMHRSGTSAMGGVLSELGIFMGRKLFSPQAGVNEKGFFENSAIVRFNDTLLDVIPSSWDDPTFPTGTDPLQRQLDDYVEAGRALLHKEYPKDTVWGVKDPRMTLLLPFWQRVFALCSLRPHYVFVIRDPSEVVASLIRRDGFSTEKALYLWLLYNLTAIEFTKDVQRLTIDYQQLCDDPNTAVARLADFVAAPPQGVAAASEFIDSGMKRQHRASLSLEDSDDSRSRILFEAADSVYRSVAGDPESTEAAPLFSKLTEELAPGREVLAEHLLAVKHSEVHYRRLFDAAYNSVWWKLALPLKKLEEALRGRQR